MSQMDDWHWLHLRRRETHCTRPLLIIFSQQTAFYLQIIPSAYSQGSLNTTVIKLSRYWRNRSQATLRQHICLNRKKFHAPALPPRRYSLCCCCRWYGQKLTVATFSRCLWRLERILIDRHQGASCYGTHPAPINYNYNYLHFCELDGPILPTNISTANTHVIL